MHENESFGSLVKERRALLGMTQAQLANAVGCATVTISKIETNQLRPSAQLAQLLATAFKLSGLELNAFVQVARGNKALTPLPSPSPSPDDIGKSDLTGRAIKEYEFAEQIGKGSFGVVYRARQPSLNRDVAIKVIHPKLAQSTEFHARFEKEAALLARLEHPHIVPLFDYWLDDNLAYIVMRYFKGGNLQDLLAKGPLSIDQFNTITHQVGWALKYIHSHGIIHQDLKPANILLDNSNNAYLGDFGIGRDLNQPPSTHAMDNEDTVTSPFLSPEQLNNEPIGIYSDIYSFGLLIYSNLSGNTQFKEVEDPDQFTQPLMSKLPRLSQLYPHLPQALDRVIEKALDPDPQSRYRDLDSLLSHLSVIWHSNQVAPAMSSSALQIHRQSKKELQDNRHSNFSFRPIEINPSDSPLIFNTVNYATSFVGRQKELEDIGRLLENKAVRLITIFGPGGMGKTRLLIESVNAYAKVGTNRFSDGIYFVPFAPLKTPDQILNAITTALKIVDRINSIEQLSRYLQNLDILLLLDNLEHLLHPDFGSGAQRIIASIINELPNITIMVSSRERLSLLGEHVYYVAGLQQSKKEDGETSDANEDDAVQLFLQTAKQVKHGFELKLADLPVLNKICSRVSGVPLALELTAAWVSILSLNDILAELEKNIDFLETQTHNISPRHQSMRATLDTSWNLLPPPLQKIYAILCTTTGGFTRQAAQKMTDASLKQLTDLIHKSFLQFDHESNRFAIHELLKQFGQTKLEEYQWGFEAKEAHGQFYLNFLGERSQRLKGAELSDAMVEVISELENLHLAWQWAIKQKNHELIDKAIEPMFISVSNYKRSTSYEMVISIRQEALKQFRQEGTEQPPIWYRLASRNVRAGKKEQPLIEEALAYAHKQNNLFEIAWCTGMLGLNSLLIGSAKDAVVLMEKAATLFLEIGAEYEAAYFLEKSADGFFYQLYQIEKAYQTGKACLALHYKLGVLGIVDNMLYLQSDIALSRADFDRVQTLIHDLLSRYESNPVKRTKAWQVVLLQMYGLVTFLLGDFEKNRVIIEKARPLWKQYGYVLFSFDLVNGLRAIIENDFDGALKYYDGYEAYGGRFIGPSQRFLLNWGRSIAHFGKQNFTEARHHLGSALEVSKQCKPFNLALLILPVAALHNYLEGEYTQSIELLSIVPLELGEKWSSWVFKISIFDDLRRELIEKEGASLYNKIWQREKSFDLNDYVNLLLNELKKSGG